MGFVMLVGWLCLGAAAFAWITHRGWVLERSAPLAETRGRRVQLGAALVVSAVVTLSGGYLLLSMVSD